MLTAQAMRRCNVVFVELNHENTRIQPMDDQGNVVLGGFVYCVFVVNDQRIESGGGIVRTRSQEKLIRRIVLRMERLFKQNKINLYQLSFANDALEYMYPSKFQ